MIVIMLTNSKLMFSPFVVKHDKEDFKISDANFVKRSPNLFIQWHYKRHQFINDMPVNCKDIIDIALSLGCVNLLIELFENGSMREAIHCYKQMIRKGIMPEEYENMLVKMMKERDDYLEASSLPMECLARLCRTLPTKKRIELARVKGGQSSCLLLIGIDPHKISPDMMTEIGKIEGWIENKKISECYSKEISKLKKEIILDHQEISKLQDELKKKECKTRNLEKQFQEKEEQHQQEISEIQDELQKKACQTLKIW